VALPIARRATRVSLPLVGAFAIGAIAYGGLYTFPALSQAFAEESELDRRRRESLARTTHLRAATRARKRVHKRGSMRYSLLVLSIILTAVVVTIAMFETLYYLLG